MKKLIPLFPTAFEADNRALYKRLQKLGCAAAMPVEKKWYITSRVRRKRVFIAWHHLPAEHYREVWQIFAVEAPWELAEAVSLMDSEQLATLKREDFLPVLSAECEEVRLIAIRRLGSLAA